MKYDGMLFGNGLTLNLLYQLKKEIPEEKRYLLNIDDFLKAWLKGGISQREERIIYSSIYGNKKDKWKYFEIVKKELGTYYQEFDSNIEYTIGYLLFKKSEYADIVRMFPALYNIWYIILKDYLEYLGLNEQINHFYQSVKDITGMPTYVFTTNFDLFAEMLNPQHLHGKFVTKMKTCNDVAYKVINSGENFYFRYIWGHNGIGKMNCIQLLSEYDDHQEYFDFDYFYDEKFEINNMLIYGMGFKKSGYIDDLKMQFKRYEEPVLGGIIDEHVLLRIKGLQTMKRLKHIDVTYFDEEEKIHLEKVLQEVGIEDYGLIKCQDFNFVV